MWNNDTGALLCRQRVVYGGRRVRVRVRVRVRARVRVRVRANPNPNPNPNPNLCGRREIDESRFDEPGYIATPPCLWGAREHGLETPPRMNGGTRGSRGSTSRLSAARPPLSATP